MQDDENISPEERELIQEVDAATSAALAELKELLEYSKQTVSLIRMRRYAKQKTKFRFNLFSSIYQRITGIVVLLENKQASAANVLLRSTWELLVANDFVNMKGGNYFLEVLHALEGKFIRHQWSKIKELRTQYPNSETFESRWSLDEIDKRIEFGERQVERFTSKYPSDSLSNYRSLTQRIKKVDDYNILNSPRYKYLQQMNYYTLYAVLSDDVHTTLYGTSTNSRNISGGIEIALEKKGLISLRIATTAYSMMLNYIHFMTIVFKLRQRDAIKGWRQMEKDQHEIYMQLDKKWTANAEGEQ